VDLERRHQAIFDFDHELVDGKTVKAEVLTRHNGNLERILTDLLSPFKLTFEKYNSRSYLILSRNARNPAKSTSDNAAADPTRLYDPIVPLSLAISRPNTLTGRGGSTCAAGRSVTRRLLTTSA